MDKSQAIDRFDWDAAQLLTTTTNNTDWRKWV